jgi:coenzyme F420 hydrogenase subunit beta
MGRIIETSVLSASDGGIRQKATDGGAVTALLLHLFHEGRIDGAIVAKQVGPFQRRPFLATSEEEILAAAGFFFDTSHGMKSFSDQYMTYSSIEEFDPLVKKGLERVALVGTPCQIHSVRRMQAMGLVPSDSIRFCLGLFCSGNFIFGEEERAKLADWGAFRWEEVRKINVKEDLMVHLQGGEIRRIPLEKLDTIRRYACRFCPDYAAEYADISFGGIGADEGWTTVISRTPLGRAALADAKGRGALTEYSVADKPDYASRALEVVTRWSERKKKAARENRSFLGTKSVQVKG